ncbi:hypothetical protein ACTFIR_002738 [Dictyostelium discoideum]
MKNEQSNDGEKGDQIINSQMIINNVLIDGRSTGLLGRVFLNFAMENGGDLQFENDCEFQIGDTVGVRFQSSKPNKMMNYQILGEIYKIKSNKIIISVDCDDPTLFSSFGQPYKWVQEDYSFIKFSIDKMNINENQNKILKETLESLNRVNGYEKYKTLFEDDDNNNESVCTTKDQFKNSEIVIKDLENNIINNNQDIIKIINSNNTCKVKTITDIINHLIKSNDKNKILVYSPSNESIDFICNGLYDDKNNINNELITKIGSSGEIKSISLEYKIKHSEGGKSIKQIKQDIIELANNTLDSKKSDFNSSISKITSLKKDLNKLEKSLINKTINESRIVLSSSNINSLDKFLKDKNDFDWVIIDESNLILDKTCLVPILKGKKLIVISDYHN